MGALSGAFFYAAFGGENLYNRPAGAGNAPLLVAGATTFPPAGGLYSSLCVSFILPPLAGEVRRSRIGGGERSEPISRMLLAVRTAMEHPIGALPRTPFPASRDFAPVGSMSLDFQVASLSYKSSSFATSRGNEKIGGTGYCVTYDTESQSRNADFILIALRAIPQPSA